MAYGKVIKRMYMKFKTALNLLRQVMIMTFEEKHKKMTFRERKIILRCNN